MTIAGFTQARVRGSVGWTCPNCGSVNRREVRPGDLKVLCSDRLCKRRLTLVLIAAPRGRRNRDLFAQLIAKESGQPRRD